MKDLTKPVVEGFILELYMHGQENPWYVTEFDPSAEIGFDEISEDRKNPVVFESRESLLPLASIEVEAITVDGDNERSVYDGFRILPFQGADYSQFITSTELDATLEAFEA